MEGKMGALNELIEKTLQKKTLQKKKAKNLNIGNYCIICGVPKDDIDELTCGHPQCINTVIECAGDEGKFSMIAHENKIESPDDLEDYLKEIDKFCDFINEESIRDSKHKIELIFKALNVQSLQEALNEIKSAMEKLK
ncbi:MAG TPA: hypothetical protein PLQ44_02105 [Candidatus Paceibacterota bacterium]|nr:hypothetical protein [Candidatus Paceibacterota bacterium]